MPAGSDSNELRERIAKGEQRGDDFDRRLTEAEKLAKSFANETGTRIRWEAKQESRLDQALEEIGELKEQLEEMEILAREKQRFSTTTKFTLGGLALTAGSLVVAVLALVH